MKIHPRFKIFEETFGEIVNFETKTNYRNNKYFKFIKNKISEKNILLFLEKEYFDYIYHSKIYEYNFNFYKKNLLRKNFFFLKNLKESLLFFSKELAKIIIQKLIYTNLPKFNLSNINIALRYCDGFDINYRSDLTWYDQDKFQNISIIVYFENKDDFIKFKKKNVKPPKHFQYFYAWKYKPRVLVKNEKHSFKFTNLWLKNKLLLLIANTTFWERFFKLNRIDLNIDQVSEEQIFRYIAMNNLKKNTIGHLRSYPSFINGDYFNRYNFDKFIIWGKDSENEILKKSKVIKKTYRIGFPYKRNLLSKKNFFEDTKKTIIFADSTYAFQNKMDLNIVMDAKYLKNIYINLFKFIQKENYNLILKPKKNIVFNDLKLDENLNKIIKSGKCKLINYSQDLPTSNISNLGDILCTAGIYFPSVTIECLREGQSYIHFDYGGISRYKKNIKNKYNFINFIYEFDEFKKLMKDNNKNTLNKEEINHFLEITNNDVSVFEYQKIILNKEFNE